MATKQYGPFGVVGAEVATGIQVQAGDIVRTVSEGLVDFGGAILGGGAPILNADGDSWSTPGSYPAPSLRKNSLICKVGARWYQGGTDKTFTPSESGEIILRTNDDNPGDNSRGWTVTLYVTPIGDQQEPKPEEKQPEPKPGEEQPKPKPKDTKPAETQPSAGQPGYSCSCCCANQAMVAQVAMTAMTAITAIAAIGQRHD